MGTSAVLSFTCDEVWNIDEEIGNNLKILSTMHNSACYYFAQLGNILGKGLTHVKEDLAGKLPKRCWPRVPFWMWDYICFNFLSNCILTIC
jgi:hypothetical protein